MEASPLWEGECLKAGPGRACKSNLRAGPGVGVGRDVGRSGATRAKVCEIAPQRPASPQRKHTLCYVPPLPQPRVGKRVPPFLPMRAMENALSPPPSLSALRLSV
ncbi:MAG: hypothetical protein GY820_42595 [Gammaproteobacteria bacterium]|nr:hypothetical protein [Gammaproteobacteria bacterium]